jgi:D-3-phosphoglycerate dehydrogenase
MTQNNQAKKKILVTWRLMINEIHKYKKLLKKENISYDVLHVKQYATTSDLIKIISKYDGLICGDDQLDKKVLSKAKKLKIISKWGTGLDSIDLEFAKQKNIKVFNSPGAFTNSVADHALALMFSITRNIVHNHNDILKGNWSKRICENISEKTFGIIGYGKIGKMIKKRLSGYKVKFLINDLKKQNIKTTSKTEIFKKSDILFLSVDLNNKSKNMLSKKEFNLMKKNLILINVCRGQVINMDDLYIALKNRLIAAAGLDVFDNEPLMKNNKFLKLNNCIVTSHNAFNSESVISMINKTTILNLLNGFKNIKK